MEVGFGLEGGFGLGVGSGPEGGFDLEVGSGLDPVGYWEALGVLDFATFFTQKLTQNRKLNPQRHCQPEEKKYGQVSRN